MGGQLLAFLGVSLVVIVVPGPDTALTIRNALAGGRRPGVATAAGVATGQAVWTVATSVGIAELIQASEPAFVVMKAVGAVYLVALGLQSLWTAARPSAGDRLRSPTGGPGTGGSGSRAGRAGLGPGRPFRQGVISNLANPKMAAFFLSLLPQFASPGRGAGGVVLLGLVFCLMTFAWLALYATAVDRLHALLSRTAVRRAIDAVMGTLLMALGGRLALERR